MKDIISELIITHPGNYTTIIRARYKEFHNQYIIYQQTQPPLKLSEYVWLYLHDFKKPECAICKTCVFKFINVIRGYKSTCSKLCRYMLMKETFKKLDYIKIRRQQFNTMNDIIMADGRTALVHAREKRVNSLDLVAFSEKAKKRWQNGEFDCNKLKYNERYGDKADLIREKVSCGTKKV